MPIRRGFTALLLIFVTLGVYYPSIFAGSNSLDDVQLITGYLNVDHFDLKGLFLPGSSGYYYRPLLGVTFVFDNIVWGMRESFMHLENVIFHTVNVILVFLVATNVARRYAIDDGTFPLVAALLFAIHPINTESVNWISGRTDLLAGIFILFSILMLLNALQRTSILMCAVAALSFLLSCFAKEVAVFALPGLIFLVLFNDSHGTILERLKKRWLFCLLLTSSAMLYFFFRALAFSSSDTGIKAAVSVVNSEGLTALNAIQIILKAFGFYLKKIFIPWPLNFAIVKVSDLYVIAGVIFFSAIIFMFYKRNLISAFFLISCCVLSPALLVVFGKMAWTPLAERYLYIPCTTFSIALSLLIYRSLPPDRQVYRKPLYALFTLIFVISTYTTVNRNIVWQSNVTLFQDTLRKSPGFFLAQNALAHALEEVGRTAEAKQIVLSLVAPEGNKRGEKLVDSNRAKILAAEGDLSGAKKLLLRNIEDSGVFYANIAEQIISIDMNLLNKERNERKKQELRQEIVRLLLKLSETSKDPLYYYRIGQFYLRAGDKAKAQYYFAEAYQRSPDGAYYKPAAKKIADKLKL